MGKTTKLNRAEAALRLCKAQFEAMLVDGTKRLEMIEMAKMGITFCEVNNDTIGTEVEISEQCEGGTLPAECWQWTV